MKTAVSKSIGKDVPPGMLIGEYQYTLDAKGRIMVPAKIKDDLGGQFILAKGLDNCLFMYPIEGWMKLEERIRDSSMVESRSVARFLFASAVQVETDKQGRFLIPQYLREYAGLDKDVTIIGASVRAEIWSKERWEAVCASLTNDQVVEAMVKLGF